MDSRTPTAPLSRCEKLLLLLFLLTLPLANPWVRGDGVGYYAYARALLIQGDLRFEQDWLRANPTFRMSRVDADGRLTAEQFTSTGYIHNNFSVGPAMLWLPWLIATHWGVLALNALGTEIPADGFSRPYIVTLALATALYGFLGLWLSFRVARKYVEERWAFLATVGIWFASSLPVYMYFNPSWSHAHSVFAVALFLWYWERTRGSRSAKQWGLLGLLSGLMINVYYPNSLLMVVPAIEALSDYGKRLRSRPLDWKVLASQFAVHVLFLAAMLVGVLPTLLTRQLIYGHPLETGYPNPRNWHWDSPALLEVLFSSNHGLFSWTPILLLGVAGLFLLRRADRALATYFLTAFVAYYFLIASRPGWSGLSSYGNRFFVSLTPMFILGLASLLETLGQRFAKARRGFVAASALVAMAIVWNAGFVLQWGTHMIPVRGPISWREMVHNQFFVVPQRIGHELAAYLFGRSGMMRDIEQKDFKKLKTPQEE